jgi:hypothetical protein
VLGVHDEQLDRFFGQLFTEPLVGDELVAHDLLGWQLVALQRLVQGVERRDVGDRELEPRTGALASGVSGLVARAPLGVSSRNSAW